MLTVTSIDSGSLALTSGTTTDSSTFTLGTTLEGTGTVTLSDSKGGDKYNTVTYTIAGQSPSGGGQDDITPTKQSHNAAITASAGTVALNQGVDTLSAAAFNLANSGHTRVQGFSSVGGGTARAQTGSHLTLNSLNFSVGVGTNVSTDKIRVLIVRGKLS
ncbi:MAG: hypothetical protein J6M93_02645 [Succinivibrio sp.]|nr:hypothetical protein [Succinivibrio sp.]